MGCVGRSYERISTSVVGPCRSMLDVCLCMPHLPALMGRMAVAKKPNSTLSSTCKRVYTCAFLKPATWRNSQQTPADPELKDKS
jgi:hypothetical protein